MIVSMTMYVARIIDRFLFPNETNAMKGFCGHSGAVRRYSNIPHQFVAKLKGAYIPSEIILLADGKILDYEKACNESRSYSIVSKQRPNNDPKFRVQLTLSYSSSSSCLEVHVEVRKGLWVIPIAECGELGLKSITIVCHSSHYYVPSMLVCTISFAMTSPKKVNGSCQLHLKGGKGVTTNCSLQPSIKMSTETSQLVCFIQLYNL